MYAAFYLLLPERIESALFVYLKLNNINPAQFNSENLDKINLKLGNIFPPYASGIYPVGIFENYQVIWQAKSMEIINKYRLDYLIIDLEKDQEWNLNIFNNLKEIKQISHFKIYQFYD